MTRHVCPVLLTLLLVAAPAWAVTGPDRRPISPPAVSKRVPFHKQMSPADRKVSLYGFDLLWDATETCDWDAVRDRLRTLLASRVVAGPWDAETVAGLTYCYLFAEYVPQFSSEPLGPFETSRFQRWLLAHPELTGRFVFALSDRDDVGAAVAILHELYSHSAKTVTQYPDLAVAMAIVFDKNDSSPQQRKDTFRWLTSSQVGLADDVRKLPHEVARYLVDQRVSRDERKWAYQRYRKEGNLDNVYHDVEYDHEAHIGKRPKHLAGKNYTLQNIQAYGGTCGDQAYYAVQIGRTQGWPVAAIEHHGPGIVGHCWCLQLRQVNDDYVWSEVGGRGFGWVVDPATGSKGSDQTLSFLLPSLRQGRQQREVSAALAQVALRVPDWVRAEVPISADVLRAVTRPPNQGHAIERMKPYYSVERKLEPLRVLRQALEADPCNATAWAAVQTLGRRGRIAPDDLAGLLDRLASLTGERQPDVVYFALLNAHQHLPPQHERRFLEAARKSLTDEQVKRAPELSANLFMLAGDLFAQEQKFEKALERYKAAIEVDPEYPPIVIRAVEKALPLAKQQGQVQTLENACRLIFTRTRDPKFGAEIGRICAEAGLTWQAVNWYRWVYDWSEFNAPGRYDSLRSAIKLLIDLEQYYAAERWSHELYDATTHPDDGRCWSGLLRTMGRHQDAARASKLVQENEQRRLQRVAEDAARRAGQVR